MKLQLTINGKSLLSEYTATENRVALTSERVLHEAQLEELQPGLFTVILNGKVLRCAIDKLPGGGADVIVNGQRIAVSIQDPKRLSHSAKGSGQEGGKAILISPMPGKVVRVLCEVGAEVSEGQGILVVEAMKMQNEVQSPKAGKVTEIRAIEGQTVNAGDSLAVVE